MNYSKELLSRLMYADRIAESELSEEQKAEAENMREKGYLKKNISSYSLTPQGQHFVSHLDGVKIEQTKKPILCVFIHAIQDGKILLGRRKRHPYLNILGLPGGKVEWGAELDTEAAKELLEETGLKAASIRLKSVCETFTYDDGSKELLHHLIAFEYLCKAFEGEVIEETRENTNAWHEIESLKNRKDVFPSVYIVAKHMTDPKEKGITHLVFHRYLNKDGTFTRMEHRKVY